MTDPHKDEHIEELLGKLQGIFGKLSHSEEEEAKQKIEIPKAAPQEKPEKVSAPPVPETPKSTPPPPINLYVAPTPTAPPEALSAAAPPPPSSAYESTLPLEDPERLMVPSAVYFPQGREAEAKSLAQKLETMTPRFTKVAFRLRVGVFLPYDVKGDWKEAILAKAAEAHFKAVFVAMERPLEDAKRKAIAAELEAKDIYFQEVTIASIEKKAIYTDILLGLVFFFDSRKPAGGGEETSGG